MQAHYAIQAHQLDLRQNWYRNLPSAQDHMITSKNQH